MTAAAPAGAVAPRPVTGLPAAELAALVYGADGRWCAGTSPETWFPEEPRRASGRRDPRGEKFAAAMDAYETKAQAACRFCPVELACLELAIQQEGSRRGHGIAGGTTPGQRQAIKASRGLPVRGSAVRRG
jgi:hypothetical protein